MRNIIQDKLYFSFRDTDGMLSFSMNAYDGDPQNPRFLLDENGKAFLIRRVGQVIALADMQEDLCPVLQKPTASVFWKIPKIHPKSCVNTMCL